MQETCKVCGTGCQSTCAYEVGPLPLGGVLVRIVKVDPCTLLEKKGLDVYNLSKLTNLLI